MEFVWIVLVVGLCALMWWAASRIDPHWASRDGSRFLAMAHPLSGPHLTTVGRAKETRVAFAADDTLLVQRRRGIRSKHTPYIVDSAVPDSSAKASKKAQFLLKPIGGGPDEPPLLMRMPAGSKTAARLRAMAAAK